MYFILWKFAGDKHWQLWDTEQYETHEKANDVVLECVKLDKAANEYGIDYCITKVWTTYKAYGA